MQQDNHRNIQKQIQQCCHRAHTLLLLLLLQQLLLLLGLRACMQPRGKENISFLICYEKIFSVFLNKVVRVFVFHSGRRAAAVAAAVAAAAAAELPSLLLCLRLPRSH